jgi:uncharacterized protein (DUF736 family)
MPAIGYVTASDNGTFKGQLKTLSIRADITIAPNARKAIRIVGPNLDEATALRLTAGAS